MDQNAKLYPQILNAQLKKIIESMQRKEIAETELARKELVSTLMEMIDCGFTYDYPSKDNGQIDRMISAVLVEYLYLSDRLFGESPFYTLHNNFHKQIKKARSKLKMASPETALEAKAILDDALKCYNYNIQHIEAGEYSDNAEVILFWKLWPVMDMLIRLLPHEDYPNLSNQLYGIVSEGFRSEQAIKVLKSKFDEVLPFYDKKKW